jgi:ArsR family transcriptional regulator, arsenate/arsenite/antimonite-responsive transcriptional repressor
MVTERPFGYPRRMADIFSVVADATRRDILQILLDRYLDGAAISVSDLVARLQLSQPTVSKHLKVLRDSGLVSVREEGQHRYYSLRYGPLEQLEDFVVPFLRADFAPAASAADPGGEVRGPVLPDSLSVAASGLGRIAADATAQVSRIGRQATGLVAKVRNRP